MKMENKEEIKRIDGKYYLVRELETDGEPVKINGEMVQPIKSIKSIDVVIAIIAACMIAIIAACMIYTIVEKSAWVGSSCGSCRKTAKKRNCLTKN